MAKISRYNGDVKAFAADSLLEERTVFGDTLTESDTLDANVTADYLRGWGIVGSSELPAREDFNAMGFTLGQFLAYLHQIGVPEWNATQEYHTDSITNQNGDLYVSRTDDNVGNDPASDTVNWRLLTSDSGVTISTVTPPSDSDYTLTEDEYRSQFIVLTDGAWTSDHNIILPNETRTIGVDNSGGTYNATIKTAAGAGLEITAGTSRPVVCNGTDVVNPLLAYYQKNSVYTKTEIATPNSSPIRTALNAGGNPPIYAVRAWARADASTATTIGNTATLNGSGNIASITRTASTGIFNVLFTTAMPDDNYSVTVSTSQGSDGPVTNFDQVNVYNYAASGFTIKCWAAESTTVDPAIICLQVVR